MLALRQARFHKEVLLSWVCFGLIHCSTYLFEAKISVENRLLSPEWSVPIAHLVPLFLNTTTWQCMPTKIIDRLINWPQQPHPLEHRILWICRFGFWVEMNRWPTCSSSHSRNRYLSSLNHSRYLTVCIFSCRNASLFFVLLFLSPPRFFPRWINGIGLLNHKYKSSTMKTWSLRLDPNVG